MRIKPILELVRGLAIIVALFYLGTALHRVGVPIPGGVLGLLILYAALSAKVIQISWIDRASNLLLRLMTLLFVPLAVGLVDFGSVLSHQALAIVTSLLVSFLAVLFTTGLLARWLLPDTSSPDPRSEPNPAVLP